MKPCTRAQVLTVVIGAACVAMVFVMAPESAGWWQKGIGVIFSVGFAMRVAALLTGGGPLAFGRPSWVAWGSTLPFGLMAAAGLWLPALWAWLLLSAGWIWNFRTRQMWRL